MTKTIKSLDKKLYFARRATWYSYFLYILCMLAGGYLGGTPVSLLTIVTLPLLLFLPGMARENYKSLSMLSFVALMYFIPAVVNVGKPDYDGLDVASLVLVSILFTSSMLFSRWAQYSQAGLGAP